MNSVMITTLNDNVSSLTAQYSATLRTIYNAYASEQSRWATLRLNAPSYNDDHRETNRNKFRLERKYQTICLQVHEEAFKEAAEINIMLDSAKKKLLQNNH